MANRIKGEMSEKMLIFLLMILLFFIGLFFAKQVTLPILNRMLKPLLDFLPT